MWARYIYSFEFLRLRKLATDHCQLPIPTTADLFTYDLVSLDHDNADSSFRLITRYARNRLPNNTEPRSTNVTICLIITSEDLVAVAILARVLSNRLASCRKFPWGLCVLGMSHDKVGTWERLEDCRPSCPPRPTQPPPTRCVECQEKVGLSQAYWCDACTRGPFCGKCYDTHPELCSRDAFAQSMAS